jgi:hypothetical protein
MIVSLSAQNIGLEGNRVDDLIQATFYSATINAIPSSGECTMKLTVTDLGKQYRRDFWGVKDLLLEIKPGILGLLGPNGAGKSTSVGQYNCGVESKIPGFLSRGFMFYFAFARLIFSFPMR